MGRFSKTSRSIFDYSPDKKNAVQPPPAALNSNDSPASINPNKALTPNLGENLQTIRRDFGNSPDIVTKMLRIGKNGEIPAAVVYMGGMADTGSLLESLMLELREAGPGLGAAPSEQILSILKELCIPIGEMKDVADFDELYTAMLSGDTAILLDGLPHGLLADCRSMKDRGVTEPSAQSVVRGPREAFCETLSTNITLIRRRIKDENLWLETRQIGRKTKTDVSIMFLNGVVNEAVLGEVRSRLDRIDIDGILESNYIEELIQDETFTPFPTIYNTERPDAASAGILEGRVAILVDGTPFVLLVPALFSQFIQSSEDYYQRWDFATLLRCIRYLALFIALLAPSLYIAITTFHQELLPPELLIGLAAQREGVPFPAFIEALLMELTFEILREAGVRMPRAIGQSVSIVGTLVIGQAAVEAGLVSAAMVIVVAITAISNFVLPSFSMGISIRMLRFGLMGIAASFGLYGVTVGLVALVLHLCSLRSFGVPYMSPFAPFIADDQKDAMLRMPIWGMVKRPRLISQRDIVREQKRQSGKPQN